MSTTARHGLLVTDWEQLSDPPGARLELLNGQVIVNPAPHTRHQHVCRYLANELDRQCPPDLAAEMDVEWRDLVADGGVVVDALRPDVMVTRRRELAPGSVQAAPVLVVEVLSPGNRKTEMDRKRAAYLANGLGCYVEVDAKADGAAIRWYRPAGTDWQLVAETSGDDELVVDEPFPFRVVPNSLLPDYE